jgi:hypothetical protein
MVLFYDGICGLCHGLVQWILKRDQKQEIQFCALQSEIALTLLRDQGVDASELKNLSSVIVLHQGRIFRRSSAILQVFSVMPLPWRALTLFKVFPRVFLDIFYNAIAASRYRIFGKFESCPIPSPTEKSRFLA